MSGPYENPLHAHVVEGDVFVCDPDGDSNIWMTPEAVLESLEPLRDVAEHAIEERHEQQAQTVKAAGPSGIAPDPLLTPA
jgi:hypothetical protein